MQSIDDWRSPRTADDFADLDLAGFAQEFLRRNPDYCREYHRLERERTDDPGINEARMIAMAQRWGLSFPVRPRSSRRRYARLMGARSRRIHRPVRRSAR